MKKHILKSIFAALLIASMAFTMTACGGAPAADANSSSASTPTPLTEDEYKAKFTELGESFADLQTQMSSIDPTDQDAAKKLLEDCKAPFVELASVTPPEKYAEAHEKLKSGCDNMVSYIDTALLVMEEKDATKQQELTVKMNEYMTAAVTGLTEGAQLADQVG